MARPLQYAPHIFQALKGVFCIYKPINRSMDNVMAGIAMNLARDLNNMEVRPPRQRIIQTTSQQDEGSSVPVLTSVPDLSDHPLVVGPRYLPEDFDLDFIHESVLDMKSSGVMLVSVGDSEYGLGCFAAAKLLRVYHMKAELGHATHDFTPTGTLIQRTTYHHVTHAKLDRVVAAMQAGHQKHMLQASQIDLQSQEAYELAVSGMLRPYSKAAGPVVYGMKCIEFRPPHFTLDVFAFSWGNVLKTRSIQSRVCTIKNRALNDWISEVHTINETCTFLRKLCHDLGLTLRTTAVCTQLRRIRYGHLGLQHALLRKYWHPGHILDNIKLCEENTDVRQLIRMPKLEERPERNTLLPSGDQSGS